MSEFQQIAHGRYLIKSGKVRGDWQARALHGARTVGEIQRGASREEAIDKVRELLDDRDAQIMAGRGADGSPSTREYAEAFARLGKLPDSYEAMLQAQLQAADYAITATELARAAGYENFNGANLHYGKLGQMLAEELNYNPPRREDGTVMWATTISWPDGEPDVEKITRAIERRMDDGHHEWTMRRQVVEALTGLTAE